MMALDKLGVFQFYPPKTNFEKKYGCQYEPMHMVFGVNQQGFRHKASGWWSCRIFHGAHHILIYHQRYVCETNFINIFKEWVRTHG